MLLCLSWSSFIYRERHSGTNKCWKSREARCSFQYRRCTTHTEKWEWELYLLHLTAKALFYCADEDTWIIMSRWDVKIINRKATPTITFSDCINEKNPYGNIHSCTTLRDLSPCVPWSKIKYQEHFQWSWQMSRRKRLAVLAGRYWHERAAWIRSQSVPTTVHRFRKHIETLWVFEFQQFLLNCWNVVKDYKPGHIFNPSPLISSTSFRLWYVRA